MNLHLRRSSFKRIESTSFDEFPRLENQDLEFYGCGTYQLKMAPYYYSDHINEDGDFEFFVSKENLKINYESYNINIDPKNALLIKVRVNSRHSSSTKYLVFILIDKTKQTVDAIIGHTCGCKVGKRVVGCCSHVMLLLWFFRYARHLPHISTAPDRSEVFALSDDENLIEPEENSE